MKNFETILKENGVELAEDVLEKVKKEVNENYKTINEYNKQSDKISSLEDSVKETNKLLEKAQDDLKAFDGVDTKALDAKIKELENTIKNNETEYEKKISERDFKDLVEKAIGNAKGKNAKAIMALLDIDALKESKNQEKDLSDQLKTLSEAEDSKMLFGDPEPNKLGKGDPIGAIKKDNNGNSELSMHDALADFYNNK